MFLYQQQEGKPFLNKKHFHGQPFKSLEEETKGFKDFYIKLK